MSLSDIDEEQLFEEGPPEPCGDPLDLPSQYFQKITNRYGRCIQDVSKKVSEKKKIISQGSTVFFCQKNQEKTDKVIWRSCSTQMFNAEVLYSSNMELVFLLCNVHNLTF